MEPYDPDARDADGDGIVQERTPWERPAGTRLLDQFGQAIDRGRSLTSRPAGLRVVDARGNPVAYTPTYEREKGPSGGPSPLSDHGARSLNEMGLPTVGSLVPKSTPAVAEAPVPADEVIKDYRVLPSPRAREAKEEVSRAAAKIAEITSKLRDIKLTPEQREEAGRLRRALDKVIPYVDEEHERVILSNLMFGGFYWSCAVADRHGAIADLLNNFWGTSQDSNVDLHDYIEQMWQIGGASFIAVPLLQLKNRYRMTKEQFDTFVDRTRRYLAEKKLKAGEIVHGWKDRLSTRLGRVEKLFDGTEDVIDSVSDIEFAFSSSAAPVADLDLITSGAPSAIEGKNKRILDAIAESGSEFGNPSQEYLDRIADVPTGLHSKMTREQRVARSETLHREFLSKARKQLQGEEDSPDWRMQIDNLSPEVKQMILEKSDDELIGAAKKQMIAHHRSMTGTVRVQIKPEYLPSFLADGRWKTTHETASEHSPSGIRVGYEAAALGIDPDADATLRPTSGWAESSEWKNKRGGLESSNPLALLNHSVAGHVGIYGDTTIKLKPDVSKRAKYCFGDSLAGNAMPVGFDETDIDAVYVAYTSLFDAGAGGDDTVPQLFRFLEAEASGSLANANAVTGTDASTRSYYETLIPGGFSIDEVESISIPRSDLLAMKSLTLRGTALSQYEELAPTEKLRELGFSEDEIDYLMNRLARARETEGTRDSTFDMLPGAGALRAILQQQHMQEQKEAIEAKGITVLVTNQDGIDLFDPTNYGGQEGDDIVELLTDEFYKNLASSVRDKMAAAEAAAKAPPPGAMVL